MEKQIKKIMNGLINKKGIMGAAAKLYVNDEKKARQFIKECGEQTHNERAKLYWGEKLVNQINQFCREDGKMF
jgi:hypothetical protein